MILGPSEAKALLAEDTGPPVLIGCGRSATEDGIRWRRVKRDEKTGSERIAKEKDSRRRRV